MLPMRVQRTLEPKGLLEKVKRLPPETLAEVDDFVDFLMHRAARRLTRASRHLSQPSFNRVWDNADDAAYDKP